MANITTQPTHRIHSDNEPLPVFGGEGTIVDYSADNMNRLADQDIYPAAQRNTTTTTHHNTHSPSHIPTRTSDDVSGESRFDERPGLSGGDAVADATPHAKPGIKDKIIGKSEELAGKIARDPEMAVKGTIRSEVGKV